MKKRSIFGNKKIIFMFILLLFILSVKFVLAVECGSVPTNGCDVTQDTTFVYGFYNLPNGINIEGDDIILDCNNSTLNGSGSDYGIYLRGDYDNNIITNCNIMNYAYGIIIWSLSGKADHNTIIGNTIEKNWNGVNLGANAYFTNITQNIFKNNTDFGGVYVNSVNAHSSNIWNNTVYDSIKYAYTGNHQYVIDGVENTYLDGATGPTSEGLYIYDGLHINSNREYIPGTYNLPSGIDMEGDAILDCNNSVLLNGSGSDAGIKIDNGNDRNTITNCNITNYYNGIDIGDAFYTATDNIIIGNIIEKNVLRGIILSGNVDSTNITQNIFKNNTNGIYIGDSVSTNIWNNKFIDNPTQALDLGVNNNWNLTEGGNYWSNYDSEAEGCYDVDSDFICDEPYNISGSAGSKDYLPLTGVESNITILEIIPIQVVEGVDMVKGKTTLVRTKVRNSANESKNINVTLYFEDDLKDTNDTAVIGAGEEINVDLWFVPNVAGSNKEIEIVVEEI